MSRDSRIAYIIGQLGELRELLLVIEQAGNAAPGILLKLAREKAESIDRSTRELRSPQFWTELQNHEPFADTAPAGPTEAAPRTPEGGVEAPVHEAETSATDETLDEQEEPWNMPVTPPAPTPEPEEPVEEESEEKAEAPIESEPLHEAETAEEDKNEPDTDVFLEPADEPHESHQPQPEPETPAEPEPQPEEPLYPWEQLSDEERSAAQDDKLVDYDDEETDDYDETDYEDTPAADLPADEPSAPVTLEEALQRQQAKELRKALSLNDRFRFRRELFGNSDIRMNETLALIDAMHSYDEAEDYILNDLNWDLDNPEVAEFMKIVQKHFL
ncbi:hypothetical protein QUW50_00300 [Barnesiella viscericola]|uniref:hypothetical protein n=1 Tax=Barnesiella viscericola TaxID=397865 RepID=UPI0025A41C11|nr:hypothetical protein [Barnesiella viscericola]MDM8267471.1 hypothetical protein [Barnesiella viscericola]